MIQAETDAQARAAIIGDDFTRQTGAGVAYLRQALERSFFPELWSVRTKL